MARKLYWPGLISLLTVLCNYIGRWRNSLIGFATDVGITNPAAKLDAVLAACEAILDEFNNPPNP